MRAYEIQEASKRLPVVAQSPHGIWYKTDASKVKSWYKTMYGGTLESVTDSNVQYFVLVPNGERMWGLNNAVVVLQGTDLRDLEGSHGAFYSQEDGEDLAALVKATGARNGERLYGNYILYNGKLYDQEKVLLAMPKVGKISTGAVYEVPKDARWVLYKVGIKYKPSADRVFVFKNSIPPGIHPWSTISIKDGTASDIQSAGKVDNATKVDLGKELVSLLGLKQKITVTNYIIPNTKLHKALQAISDNPGVDRPDLYWKVLKLQQLPAQGSNADVASELVNLGLVDVRQDGWQLYYTISTPGSMVLAALNNGTAIKKSDLLEIK